MDNKDLDELQKEINERKAENAIVEAKQEAKSITDISAADIKLQLDETKSMEEQAEDIVGAMATAAAVQDEATAKDLKEKKAEELKAKASTKERTAEAKNIEAETEKQKAKRALYEAVLEDFMITKHLPQWLMVIVVAILSPFYLAKIIIICVPLGFGKTLMECVDNIFVRYAKVDEKNKPKVRVTVWIVLGVLLVGTIAFTVLKCIGKI